MPLATLCLQNRKAVCKLSIESGFSSLISPNYVWEQPGKMMYVLACIHTKDHSSKAAAPMAELWYPGVLPGIV